MTGPMVAHDHVVLLLDKDEFEHPPAWLADNFTIIEGGTHTGGSSRNKLIIFRDGTYLELFNWIAEPAEFRDWANKPPGLIQFAMTTLGSVTAEQNFERISTYLDAAGGNGDGGLGVSFSSPEAGGRKRADGKDVKWKTTRPAFRSGPNTPSHENFPTGRLDTCFYCHDVTERNIRVPFEDPKITHHACGAVGISEIQVIVPAPYLKYYLHLYRSVLGVEDKLLQLDHKATVFFEVDVPSPQGYKSYVSVRASETDQHSTVTEDQLWLRDRGIGIRGLCLSTARENLAEHLQGPLGQDPIGKTITLSRPSAPA